MATIIGTPATEVLNGTADDDFIAGLAGADFIFGRGGDDRIVGGSGIDGLNGEDGNDVLIGGTDDDAIFGGDGDDVSVWRNGDGSDFIRGGDGQDTQIISGSLTDGDNFLLDQDAGLGQALFSRTNLGLFELRLDTVETVRVAGNGGNDTLVVFDLSSTDLEQVVFVGGDGDDALIDNGTSTDLIFVGGAGRDLAIGGAGNDRLLGGDDVDQLIGGAGDDRIIGGKGNDSIEGGFGDDFSIWNNGDGSDQVFGDAGDLDTQRFNMADGPGDELLLTTNETVGTFERVNFNPFSVQMFGVERVIVTGQGGDDSLTIDQTSGVSAFSSIHFTGGDAQDEFDGVGTTSRNVVSGGEGDDTIASGSGNDRLDGGAGQDVIIGGAGNDRIIGGAGDDTLTGGDGRDAFSFASGSNNDRVLDFVDGEDRIRFDGVGFNFNDLTIATQGGDIRIQTPDGDSITLVGIAGATIDAADFAFL